MTDSLVHDTPATMNGKADTNRVSQAVAATPEAARKTGAAIRRNPTPVAAVAIVLAGATAAVLRLRAARKPQTRTQRVRAAVTTLPSRMRRTPSMTTRMASKLGRGKPSMAQRLGLR
ncbi:MULTISPECIES: hypothetical protein [Catenuloplanes]|uniref:Transcription initiation factor TFIIIB Brf1 subunit/transcription initiation factor TFIIB n=1 Tax=Catenuloplanes niger TaxID=587534 RepID=A0AAE3ZVX0_9ACTN|nr:hypothetical protein [Catenuloplanes niger]MDR7326857.1 transcription initiation factor TFIIIB Brf1 subunit/transcription initiation factor TFIIB [Catenuloplanes niger]